MKNNDSVKFYTGIPTLGCLNMLANLITPEADKLKYWDFGSGKKKRKVISGKICSLAFCCSLDL